MRALLVTVFLMTSAAVAADTVFGVYAGVGTWKQEFTGEVASGANGFDIDVEDDLGLQDEQNSILYVALEHPIPGVPNVRLQKADIAVSGDATLARAINFNGTTFNISDDVSTDVELAQTDVLFYYEVLDNVVSLDVGVAARWIDGYIDVVSTLENVRAEFKGVLPLIYGKARVDLPFSGGWVSAELQGIGYDGNSLLETNIHAGWESPIGLGLEGGWRTFALDLDGYDEIDSASFKVKGPYVALNFHL